MKPKSTWMNEEIYQYMMKHSLREADILRELRIETSNHPWARMQICPIQGQLMALLTKLVGATKSIEVGVFTGYSSLAVALAMPDHGTILACDINEEFTQIAQRYWQKAGVAHKINLKLAPAQQTLSQILSDKSQHGSFDFAFIDADKQNYASYYESCLTLVKSGGLILVDNTLWDGRVADEQVQDADTLAIRQLNSFIHQDQRVDLSLLPVADGLSILRKR